MSTTIPASTSEIEVFRQTARYIHKVVGLNVEGFTQPESLIQPQPAGNCMNWVLGHMLCTYNHVLPMLEQRPVMKSRALERYDRGSCPVRESDEVMEISELMSAWEEAVKRIDAGLANLTPEILDAPAPFSPAGDPNETVRSLLSVIFFHQAYHAGQTGILRRIAGKKGAIA